MAATTELELWQAVSRTREEARGAFQQYDGEAEFGDTDTTELRQRHEAASAAQTEALLAFFGDRRLYDEMLAAQEVVDRLQRELDAAKTRHSKLCGRFSQIQDSFYGQDLASALQTRGELLAEEDRRIAAGQQ